MVKTQTWMNFAMGSTTETSYYGPTRISAQTQRMFRRFFRWVPCAAVAGIPNAIMSLGSDTGGRFFFVFSIRQAEFLSVELSD